MSNRGRQCVASFLIFDLEVPWWWGAEHFEKYLIDHDVTANWGNWVHAAGIANSSARINRFNMIKQATDYDKNGDHAKHWIIELRGVRLPNNSIHQLATNDFPLSMRKSYGISAVYSPPIVNLKAPHVNVNGGSYTSKKNNSKSNKKQKGRIHQGRF